MQKGTVLNKVFDRLQELIDTISAIDTIDFATSPDYGNVTSCPTNLGTGMRASVHMPLPRLTQDGTDRAAKVCRIYTSILLARIFILYIPYVSLTSLECQASESVNSDTRPRPTTGYRQAARPLGPRPGRGAHANRRGRHRRHLAERALLHHGGRNFGVALQGD
jgi:hypothetical protein